MNESQMKVVERLQRDYQDKLGLLEEQKAKWQSIRALARQRKDDLQRGASSDAIAVINVKIQQVVQFIHDLDSMVDSIEDMDDGR